MARSIEALFVSSTLMLASACGGDPSKAQALQIVQRDVKEEGSCTLPMDVLSAVKNERASRAICVPIEGGSPKAQACLDALVSAGVTAPMPASYMVDWTDASSLPGVGPYEKKARNLVFKSCVEMRGGLREGRFDCAVAKADKIVKISKTEDTRAEVRYARTLSNKPFYAAVEKACGAVSAPPGEASVTLVKDVSSSSWVLLPAQAEAP